MVISVVIMFRPAGKSIAVLIETLHSNVLLNVTISYNPSMLSSILVSLPQARCRHRRQYRHHQVSQLRRGNESYISLFISY